MASAPQQTSRPRRGRPSRAEAEALDRRILDAGWQTFLDVGFEAATMELLAERAGVTRNTLYARHGDKLALLRATVADRLGRWAKASSQASGWSEVDVAVEKAVGKLESRLIAFAETVLAWSRHAEVLATARLVRGSTGEAGEIARELDHSIREAGLRDVARMIARFTAQAGSPARDPMTVARLLLGMLEALAPLEIRPTLGPERDRAIARQVVAVLLHGKQAW